jgi:hypothetical protein
MCSFKVPVSSISFLTRPSDYLSCLRDLVKSSRRRVFMSALYLGTDSLSQSLVDVCSDVLSRPAPPTMQLIFDKGRATRGPGKTSVDMCSKLLAQG